MHCNGKLLASVLVSYKNYAADKVHDFNGFVKSWLTTRAVVMMWSTPTSMMTGNLMWRKMVSWFRRKHAYR